MKLTLALLTAIGGAQADPILFSIGADGLGVPRQLFQIDVGAANVTPLALLGDGSLSYGGGLAYRTGSTFDGLETDSFGSVNRVSYTSAGAVSNIAAAGSFSGGGMANVGGTVHWIANDFLGNSTLTTSVTANSIGTGFNGGLAYRSTDGLAYAVQNDGNGNSSVHSVNLTTFATTQVLSLGQGFLGGLAWDPATDTFYVIGSDSNGASSLFRFVLGDTSPTSLFALGNGFNAASLTIAAADQGVPEPSSFLLCAAVLSVRLFKRRA